jgi:hypothetical protein
MARLMLTDLYDALRAANIPEDKARAAASSVADFAGRIERFETKLTMMMSLLGVMLAVMLGGFYAVWAQLVVMSAS